MTQSESGLSYCGIISLRCRSARGEQKRVTLPPLLESMCDCEGEAALERQMKAGRHKSSFFFSSTAARAPPPPAALAEEPPYCSSLQRCILLPHYFTLACLFYQLLLK
ncbi:hypothetical protein DPX16_2741 [Anabarilius grahami]|uniref:Uncharacterized protein n=1 Tax=Anabarilius grahami TaxID=495550 RepID=A0A3N0XGP4_ANAGA|nr:hypothetical protein DPX16_2741 [Anabarilius grahami]